MQIKFKDNDKHICVLMYTNDIYENMLMYIYRFIIINKIKISVKCGRLGEKRLLFLKSAQKTGLELPTAVY